MAYLTSARVVSRRLLSAGRLLFICENKNCELLPVLRFVSYRDITALIINEFAKLANRNIALILWLSLALLSSREILSLHDHLANLPGEELKC